MSNLNNNTTQLEILLEKVNALPNAGGGGTNTSDATATADEIFAGETAYTADGKVTGTFTIDEELTEQNDLIEQISTLVATKATPPSTDTSDATATASDILNGKTAYVKGEKITGNIPSKGATTYTPTTSNQTISSGTYLSGTQTIIGDANLKAENIANGVSIFGVAGTHNGAEDLDTELTEQENLISQLGTILDSKASGGSGGGVETCTLEIVNNGLYAELYFCVTRFVDGNITDNNGFNNIYNKGTTTITNVVCNSGFSAYNVGGNVDSLEGVIKKDSYTYQITASAGETARFIISD